MQSEKLQEEIYSKNSFIKAMLFSTVLYVAYRNLNLYNCYMNNVSVRHHLLYKSKLRTSMVNHCHKLACQNIVLCLPANTIVWKLCWYLLGIQNFNLMFYGALAEVNVTNILTQVYDSCQPPKCWQYSEKLSFTTRIYILFHVSSFSLRL